MTLEQLLLAAPGVELMIANNPFSYSGKADVELDGGDVRHWMFDAGGRMLSVSPDDEELVLFRMMDEQVEPGNETIGYQGKDYEFTYEDIGSVTSVDGDAKVVEDERYSFTDYESDSGELIRIVRNENTGDGICFIGSLVGEDEVVEVE